MNTLKKQLQFLGLSEEEIILYLTTLEAGSTTVLELARKTDIPRTTIYLLIDLLVKKKLLLLSADGVKKFYVPASPSDLVKMAQQKKEEMQETMAALRAELPQLEALYVRHHAAPRIRYYQGLQEVKKIYEDTLKAEKILVHCMSQEATEVMGDYLDTYFARVVGMMIHTQEIVSDADTDKAYQKKYNTSRNQIVCIPQKYVTNTDYMIYDGKVAFITYKNGEPVGIVIEDQEIAHFETIRFQLLWDAIEKGL